MAGWADLYGSAQLLLDAFATDLQAQGVVLPVDQNGNPLTYVSPGSPAAFSWDADCLAIVFERIQGGTPGNAQPGNVNVYSVNFSATFSVILLRTVSSLTDEGIPTPSQMEVDAQLLLADASALVQSAVNVKADPPEDAFQEPFVIDGVEPIGPLGSMVANVLTFTAVIL